jgi:hypothetical protein
MFWRKIFDRNPIFITFCDKVATKETSRREFPKPPCRRPSGPDATIADTPMGCGNADVVLKANHAAVSNYFGALDATDFDELQAMTRKWLRRITAGTRGSGPMPTFPGRLFLERRLIHPEGEKLVDISVRCSDGKAILASATTDNKTPSKRSATFALDGERCREFETKDPEDGKLPADFRLPASFPLAVEYAKRLRCRRRLRAIRLLCVGDKIYPGEITVYPVPA